MTLILDAMLSDFWGTAWVVAWAFGAAAAIALVILAKAALFLTANLIAAALQGLWKGWR